jgi:hypothetical protein
LNATAKASITMPAPSQFEKTISRASPLTRDASVIPPTTVVDVSNRSELAGSGARATLVARGSSVRWSGNSRPDFGLT